MKKRQKLVTPSVDSNVIDIHDDSHSSGQTISIASSSARPLSKSHTATAFTSPPSDIVDTGISTEAQEATKIVTPGPALAMPTSSLIAKKSPDPAINTTQSPIPLVTTAPNIPSKSTTAAIQPEQDSSPNQIGLFEGGPTASGSGSSLVGQTICPEPASKSSLPRQRVRSSYLLIVWINYLIVF